MDSPADELAPDTITEIDEFLETNLVDQDVPGASVAVFDGDAILYATGFGARTLEDGGTATASATASATAPTTAPTTAPAPAPAPATADTLYHVGSITKIVTAIAVLQLVERDALGFDDEIRDHLPFVRDVPGDPVTVRELLTHSSGLPSDNIVDRENVADERDLRLHVDGATDRRVLEDPPFMYYNSGYKILGELVEVIEGRPYAEHVAKAVLAPLGMDRSTFDQTALWEVEDAMTGYRPGDDGHTPTERPLHFESQPADGGMISPVTDLVRLLQCLLDDGELAGRRVLTAETVDAMTRGQVGWNETIDGEQRGYGYGLAVEDFLGERLLGHAGGVVHAQSYVGALDERGLGVALAINTHGVHIDELARGVLAIVVGESPVEVLPGLALREKLEAVTGTYETYRGPTATVDAGEGHIRISLEDRDREVVAVPTSADTDEYTFDAVRGDGRRDPVEFRETDDGTMLLWSRFRFDSI